MAMNYHVGWSWGNDVIMREHLWRSLGIAHIVIKNWGIHRFQQLARCYFLKILISNVDLCLINIFSIKSIRQHFDILPGVAAGEEAHYGGSVSLADYCPYLQEFIWQHKSVIVRGSRCSYDENTPSQLYVETQTDTHIRTHTHTYTHTETKRHPHTRSLNC